MSMASELMRLRKALLRADPAPELEHLRKALSVDRAAYSAWIDQHEVEVSELMVSIDLDEDVSPMIRAEFIHQTWSNTP